MNNKANIFNFHNNQIRIIEKDGEPWFVTADVCRALQLNIQKNGKPNTTTSLRRLLTKEKGLYPIYTLGGAQRLSIISESGLYKLIMRSNKPEAKEFQNWVTQVVLPAIRKDGAYVQGEEKGREKRGRRGLLLNPHRRPLSGIKWLIIVTK
ncbi:BRO family, N-terminal domain [Bartonella apihabitans]|uniref:BRO family, N-terminal domain n=1 Tax=Bartonella apihabitans TaxID=2750929 RepID=A0A1U9MDQ9_9HYPH|nr:Bro-N domain-containing protein [Bartonella apihabitans]AQT43458.1 BRO family, N-terminal domain [Bartonella apihabitans]